MDWRSPRVRLLIVAALVMLWMGATLGRLAYLQLFCYSEYLNRAGRQQQRIVEISPRRGILYDRNMHELAMSISVDSCYAVPSEITDPDMVARLLSGVLGISPDEISSQLRDLKLLCVDSAQTAAGKSRAHHRNESEGDLFCARSASAFIPR